MSIRIKSRVGVNITQSLGFLFCQEKKGLVRMAKEELLSSLEKLRDALHQYDVPAPELDRYIEQVSTRADDKHVDQYNELVNAYRNSRSRQSVINNGTELVAYVNANPDLKQLPNVTHDMKRVQDSVDFTRKVNEYIDQYNSTVSIEESKIILDKIETLAKQYSFDVSFLAKARAELDSYVDTRVVNQFNEYVKQYNTRMSADKRSILANEIQAFLTANPKLKESPAGKRMDQETKRFINFIQTVVRQMNAIESYLE